MADSKHTMEWDYEGVYKCGARSAKKDAIQRVEDTIENLRDMDSIMYEREIETLLHTMKDLRAISTTETKP